MTGESWKTLDFWVEVNKALSNTNKVENRRKRMENRYIIFIFIFLDENGSGRRTTGSENGSGINGNTKTGKYHRKINGNER